jgi:hypothetical protein
MAKFFLLLLHLVMSLQVFGQKTDSYLRLRRADPLYTGTLAESADSINLIAWGFSAMFIGKRYSKTYAMPCDSIGMVTSMINAVSSRLSQQPIDSVIPNIPLSREAPCPSNALRRKKFPCTLTEQLNFYASNQRDTGFIIIPTLHVRSVYSDVLGSGPVAYVPSDSGYNRHYTWYTLCCHVYFRKELVYYDQYSYFTKEYLPEGKLPEISIPQEAMDTLVNRVLEGCSFCPVKK